ncbi:MAG: HAMP domain-containing sensor histidine kinase [Hyphomicrobiaceae bacterium]|nr:HAMP domain-containing sensor histidine kinase [Hyphomicrobiaceae bacterium]
MTAALVMAAIVVHGIVVYAFVTSTTEQRVRNDIEAEMSALQSEVAKRPTHDIARLVDDRLRGHGPYRFAYSLISPAQAHVAGDIWLKPGNAGWTRIDRSDSGEGSSSDGDVLVLTAKLGPDYVLSIGRNIHWIVEVEDELFEILIWTLLGSITMAGAAAYMVNRAIAHRIDSVTTTAGYIMQGDLTQRVPITGSGDEFDHLSSTLNEMLGRLQQLMESLEQVSNDIAHDLRTPLARLRQGLDRARTTAETPDAFCVAIDNALAEADAMLSTFTALLRIAQMESGALRPALQSVDLNELVHSIADAYELNASETGHQLAVASTVQLHIEGDRNLLAQAIVNLIENALTHTPSGTRIALDLSQVGDSTRLSVADNGPGVPAGEREKIFRRFYRLETSRTTPGTGLGLSLVAAVVRAHRGKLAAFDNHPGLRIEIDFPGQTAT